MCRLLRGARIDQLSGGNYLYSTKSLIRSTAVTDFEPAGTMNYRQLLQDGTSTPSSESVSTTSVREEIFDILSNSRRRFVVHYLKREQTPVDLSELVDHATAWETQTAIPDLDPTHRKRVYNALRQTHLPRLEEAGIVEYDRTNNDVTITEEAQDVHVYLEYVPNNDIPWYACYLGLSVVAAALIGAGWVGLYPFGGISELVLGGLVLVMFAISSIAHAYHARSNRIEVNDRFEVPEK